MIRDLRGWLDHLEQQKMLVRVKKEVATEHEIAAGIRKTSDINGPALLFENIKGYPGWRMSAGVFATRKLMALALGVPEDEDRMFRRYREFDQKRIKPKLVDTGPVKEIVIKGDDIDLTRLPFCTYCEKDGAPYLTAGVEIAKHPETGLQNASIHRRVLISKNELGLSAPPVHHLGMIIAAAEARGEGVGVATVLGAHPALTIASQVRAPMGVDEIEIAGAIIGEPMDVVRCETIDVEVPAHAEVVIEGVTVPGITAPDGPFGEYPGNYISLDNFTASSGSPVARTAVVKVTAITMRENPIFGAMLTGMPMTENHILKKWSMANAIYRQACTVSLYDEDIVGVNLTAGGNACSHAVISIRKRTEAMPRDLIYTLLATRFLTNLVTVVDDDIDIYDAEHVEWAVMSRVRPDKDIIILPSVPAPIGSSAPPVHMYKWGIDATKPILKDQDKWWYDRSVPPGVDKVDYI